MALIAANVIVYASVWHHDFVNYDDGEYVTENPIVSAWTDVARCLVGIHDWIRYPTGTR